MAVEYNRSPNAYRAFTTYGRSSSMGRSTVQADCPFCTIRVTIYLWSLAGGGKKCTNNKCGAIFTSFGICYPVAGREPK
jgi:hypothetical protein